MRWFSKKELECPCCNKVAMDPSFEIWINRLRDVLGEPIYVTSAYRCLSHNADIGGAPDSKHLYGLALDVKYSSASYLYRLIKAAMFLGVKGIEVCDKHVHLDLRTLPEQAMWLGVSY
jgi:zinc D-Ala-D-Ala carboxypeptidase